MMLKTCNACGEQLKTKDEKQSNLCYECSERLDKERRKD